MRMRFAQPGYGSGLSPPVYYRQNTRSIKFYFSSTFTLVNFSILFFYLSKILKQYFYFYSSKIVRQYFYFYLSKIFSQYFDFYLSKIEVLLFYFHLSKKIKYFAEHCSL